MRALLAATLLASLAGGWGCSRRASSRDVAGWTAEIARLQAEQDSLRARADVLVTADPRIQGLPKGDVVVGIPTAFLRNVIGRVFDDVAKHMTLRLGGIKAHVAKPVKKIVTIGNFVVDVDIHEVMGKLKPGQPKMDFGGDRIAMSLPVELSEGNGEATIHFLWDGKNVADLTCGDMDVTEKLTAEVIPSKYVVSGRLMLAAKGTQIICTPVFPETRILIRVKPTKASWAKVNKILEEKHGVCGWVLDKVNVPSILEGLVEKKGFNVRLPLQGLKPFAIPGGVSDTVMVAGRPLKIESSGSTLRVDPDAIWFASNVALTGH